MLVMAPAPLDVLDGFIVGSAAIYAAVSFAHVALIWWARKDFFVALRSPLLTCVTGGCIVARYISSVCSIIFGGLTLATDVDLVSLPVIWVAKVSIVLMTARIFVMYYPAHRPKYGSFTNDALLVRVLLCLYVTIETTIWLAVATIGRSRVSRAVSSLSTFPPLLTAVASMCIIWQLRNVHDLVNVSRDIRAVAIILLLTFPINVAAKMFMRPDSLPQKYTMVAYFTLSYTPIVWVLNIRPAREIRARAARSRIPLLRRMSSRYTRVGVTPLGKRSRGKSCPDTRLTVVMAMDGLRAAFGEFCYKSLCGESFQFVLDVAEFKESVLVEVETECKNFKGFGAYIAIVNDYIQDGSHSEVNIDSYTKQEILKWCTFDAYSMLSVDERLHILTRAERQVLGMLADNLLNKFMLSDQYKKLANM